MKTCTHLLHRCAIGVLFFTSACHASFFMEEPVNQPEAIFESLWQQFKTDYGPFVDRNIDWNAAYAANRPFVHAQTNDDSLYLVLSNLLQVLDDGHVNLYAPDRVAFNANSIRRTQKDADLFQLPLIKNQYLEAGYETGPDDSYVMGKLPGNIAYVHLPYVSGNVRAITKVLDRFQGVNGLILDLRHNDGGDFTWAFDALGHLTQERQLVFHSRTKNGSGPNDFTGWYDWYLEPQKPFYNVPLVVLTDRFTISAGERAVMACQTLPHCTIMGDTTSGAHATMVAGELANGWRYTLPIQETRLYDGNSYEGIGLAPQIVLKNTEAGLNNGVDALLEAAMQRF